MTHNHRVTGRWNDENCDARRSWVCYQKKCECIVVYFFVLVCIFMYPLTLNCCGSTASTLPSPPPTSSLCHSDYISWYKNCYKLVTEPKPWEEAQAACVKEGGNLASVDMSYEQAFISAVLQQNKVDTWIGLRRKVGTPLIG